MTPEKAADLAARTLAAIGAACRGIKHAGPLHVAADRERVASDLAGLLDCWTDGQPPRLQAHHAARYADGLRRTAALYGVTP